MRQPEVVEIVLAVICTDDAPTLATPVTREALAERIAEHIESKVEKLPDRKFYSVVSASRS